MGGSSIPCTHASQRAAQSPADLQLLVHCAGYGRPRGNGFAIPVDYGSVDLPKHAVVISFSAAIVACV
eukprot:21820-Karenia_brevis.AAC.1